MVNYGVALPPQAARTYPRGTDASWLWGYQGLGGTCGSPTPWVSFVRIAPSRSQRSLSHGTVIGKSNTGAVEIVTESGAVDRAHSALATAT